MSKTALFIYSPFGSHLTKTSLISKELVSKGYKVVYCVFRSDSWFAQTTSTEVIVTQSEPIGFSSINKQYKTASKSERKQLALDQLHNREVELRAIIDQLHPDLVFFDELCTYDYFLISDLISEARKFTLIPTLPNCPGTSIPPLSKLEYPGKKWYILWRLRQLKLMISDAVNSKINPIVSSSWTIKNTINSHKSHKYTFYDTIFPVIRGLTRVYLSYPDFDFYDRKLPKNEIIGGAMIDENRLEFKHPKVEYFLKRHRNNESSKLIYCGFGLVITTYLSDELLLSFYSKLNEIAQKRQEWDFLVSIPSQLMKRVRPSGLNIMFVEFAPQLEILPIADLFITHGGGSVLEGLKFGTPMLSIPPINKIDFNGNSARIKYHGIGEHAKIEDVTETLEDKISLVLNNPIYKSRATQFSKYLAQKYQTNNMDWLFLDLNR